MRTSDFVIGIDPGLHGGVVLIQRMAHGFELIKAFPMPLTKDGKEIAVRTLLNMLKSLGPIPIVLEESVACAMSFRGGARQSVASGFRCGLNFGRITGAFETLAMNYSLVHPRKWTALIHKGLKGEPKQKSEAVFRKLCSTRTQGLATPIRCRVMHDGLIDAALIAWWSLIKLDN
jgi:hypothetical protein